MNFRITTLLLALFSSLPLFAAYHPLQITNNTGTTLNFSEGPTLINDQANKTLTVGDKVNLSFTTTEKLPALHTRDKYTITGIYTLTLTLFKNKDTISTLQESGKAITLGKNEKGDIVFLS